MIYEKELVGPALKRRCVKRKLSLFRDKNGALACQGLHFREEDGCLLTAEGIEKISALPTGTTSLVASVGHRNRRFAFVTNGKLIPLDGGGSFMGVPSPKALICYHMPGGEDVFFALNETALFRLNADNSTILHGATGGSCACIACERLLTASDETVRWSKPLFPENWDESLQEAGYLSLPAHDGKIHAMVAFHDRVYLFRERGIVELCAQGDALAFCAEIIPCSCGRMIENSVLLCGENIIFLTEDGVCSFDGSRVKRLTGCGYSEINFEKGVKSAVSDGKYYASVTLKCGENCIWVIDPTEGRGHFLRARAEMLVGGDSILFAEEGKLFRLTDSGIPFGGRSECTLTTEQSLLGLSSRMKYLDGVTIEGSGFFRVEARAEKGAPRATIGKAGERCVFPAPLRGTSFSLNVRTLSENARIKNVIFDLREETGTW